jgi:hypothetical protein
VSLGCASSSLVLGTVSGWIQPVFCSYKMFSNARMAELVDALVSGTSVPRMCRFESCSGHKLTKLKRCERYVYSAFYISGTFNFRKGVAELGSKQLNIQSRIFH